MNNIRRLAIVTTVLTYMLIVLGAVVRITGSGMGCGPDWPTCNGHWIPPLDSSEVMIEWAHRIVALLVSACIGALAALTVYLRNEPGVGGRGGPMRSALLALALLVAQVVLGAVTVILETPDEVVIVHLSNAMALIASLVFTAVRAGGRHEKEKAASRTLIVPAAILTGITILLGGLTANMGAGPACLGFPLCSGSVLPPTTASGLAAVHWVHRVIAFALSAYAIGLLAWLSRTRSDMALRTLILVFSTLVLFQVGVAAVMILAYLPEHLRAVHAAIGTAAWVVVMITVARL